MIVGRVSLPDGPLGVVCYLDHKEARRIVCALGLQAMDFEVRGDCVQAHELRDMGAQILAHVWPDRPISDGSAIVV